MVCTQNKNDEKNEKTLDLKIPHQKRENKKFNY